MVVSLICGKSGTANQEHNHTTGEDRIGVELNQVGIKVKKEKHVLDCIHLLGALVLGVVGQRSHTVSE